MKKVTITCRMGRSLHEAMKRRKDVNWNVVIENGIKAVLAQQSTVNRRRAASADMDRIRASGVFSGGKPAEEEIRWWRDNRHKQILQEKD